MISYLSVKNFKLAESVTLEFNSGFTALTGETGAGKSLIVDALGLLLGDRGRPDNISSNADRAEIEAVFDLPESHIAQNWMNGKSLGAGGECIVRRILSRKSSSRAFINGTPVPVQELRQLGALLVDIHGQHEHQNLLSSERQRDTLDAYDGLSSDVEMLRIIFSDLNKLQDRFDRLKNRNESDRDRARLLEFQIQELNLLSLEPDEEQNLQRNYNRLAHAQELLQGISGMLDMLYESEQDSINERIGRAGQKINTLLPYDDNLKSIASQFENIGIEVTELASDLRQKISGYEFDPDEFHQIQQRLDVLHDAARKYRMEINQLPELLEKFNLELSEIAGDDETLTSMSEQIADLSKKYDLLAHKISSRRVQSALVLGKKVEQELADLGMKNARFSVHIEPLETRKPWGYENVEFLIATNPGQTAGQLSRIASGGELSRVALSINMVSNQGLPASTQVYDEVDAGIGGGIAEMVGQKLRELSTQKQVLCVTHLGQVASQAGHHKKVTKSGDAAASVSIRSLAGGERTEEIARMLGGIEITERTLQHADEMLGKASTP